MTRANRGIPFSFRQCRSALFTRMNTPARMLSRDIQPAGLGSSEPRRGKGGFNGVSGPNGLFEN